MKTITALLTLIAFSVANANDGPVLALNMYSSHRAVKKGDLVTVIVDESSSASKQESMDTTRSSTASAPAPTLGDATGGRLSRALSRIDIPSYEFNGSADFSGSGGLTSSESLTGNFTVRVADVLSNGLLVLRGERHVLKHGESVTMTLTGLVRPRDVGADNTVLSSRLSDATIRYESDGQVSQDSRPAWLWRVFMRVIPF